MDGYGHPSTGDSIPGGGYGHPTVLNVVPATGYGFPSSGLAVLSLSVETPNEAFPDDGGEFVTLRGTFTPTPGPYYVRLVGQDGTYYPSAGYAYSGVSGSADACYPDVTAESLKFVLPPAPPGLYDVEVSWGPSKGSSATLPDSLPVKRRTHSLETYELRNALPGWSGLGPRDVREEPTL